MDCHGAQEMRTQDRAAIEAIARVYAPPISPTLKQLTPTPTVHPQILSLTRTVDDLRDENNRLICENKLLRARLDRREPGQVQEIIRAVADGRGVTVKDIFSRRRHHKIVRARQHAMWELRTHTILSFPEIGRAMGGLDHTTVMHGARQHQSRIDRGDA